MIAEEKGCKIAAALLGMMHVRKFVKQSNYFS